jgi:hypothetical protein
MNIKDIEREFLHQKITIWMLHNAPEQQQKM